MALVNEANPGDCIIDGEPLSLHLTPDDLVDYKAIGRKAVRLASSNHYLDAEAYAELAAKEMENRQRNRGTGARKHDPETGVFVKPNPTPPAPPKRTAPMPAKALPKSSDA